MTSNKKSDAGQSRSQRGHVPTSWDALAHWYDGWVGATGSEHHREVAVPALMEMLDPKPGERILDIGAGQGVLSTYIAEAGAHYTGVDASPRLIRLARQRHSKEGRFLVGDARNLTALRELHHGEFDAVTFLLSIQDMDPLDAVLRSAAWALKLGGRVVLLLTHPAFRVPRQSGWGWDEGRKLHFRRVDRYLTPLAVPMKSLPGRARAATRSFHRPIGAYVNSLADAGLLVEQMAEIPAHKIEASPSRVEAAHRARQEIPLFLGIRARKL
ncbi:MAG TPA: class I SAM-dependent methyltransferase [Chloroflexia bacterium]|nr:class I SAM-dependent methyltransferase [Chloroflexia bacterium]